MKPILIVHYNAFNSNQAFQFPFPENEKDTTDLLESVFRQCNVVDGSEWIVQESHRRIKAGQKGLRSMSVGDSVTLVRENGWETWLCAGIGWEKIGSSAT